MKPLTQKRVRDIEPFHGSFLHFHFLKSADSFFLFCFCTRMRAAPRLSASPCLSPERDSGALPRRHEAHEVYGFGTAFCEERMRAPELAGWGTERSPRLPFPLPSTGFVCLFPPFWVGGRGDWIINMETALWVFWLFVQSLSRDFSVFEMSVFQFFF